MPIVGPRESAGAPAATVRPKAATGGLAQP